MTERRRKILTSQSKEIILNVSNFFENEIKEPSSIPTKAFIEKASVATAVSESTVRRIRKEYTKSGKIQSPKKREGQALKPIDDFDESLIRKRIHDFYIYRHELPTIAKLHKTLQEDINFAGSTTFLRTIVKNLGFKWKKTQSQRKVLVERCDIVDLRIKYLRKIESFREQGLNLLYVD